MNMTLKQTKRTTAFCDHVQAQHQELLEVKTDFEH